MNPQRLTTIFEVFEKTEKVEIYKEKLATIKTLEATPLLEKATAWGGMPLEYKSISLKGLDEVQRKVFEKDVRGWNKEASFFDFSQHPFNPDTFTITDALLQVKLAFEIPKEVTLRFWSEKYGVLVKGRKYVSFSGESKTIFGDTLLRDITMIPGLQIVFIVQDQFKEKGLTGYDYAKNHWSHKFAGEYYYDYMCGSLEEATTMNTFINDFAIKYGKQFLHESKIFEQNKEFSITDLEVKFRSYFDKFFLSKEILVTIPNDRLDSYKKAVDKLYNTRFGSRFDEARKTDPKKTYYAMMEAAYFLVFDHVMTDVLKIRKSAEDAYDPGTSIDPMMSELKKSVENPDSKQFIVDYINHEDSINRFFKIFREAFFNERSSIGYDRGPTTFHGRINEANDYFNKLPERFAEALKESNYDYESIAALDGINFGTGQVLGFNKYLENSFQKVEAKMLGVDLEDFQPISRTSPSDRRFFDNDVVVLLLAFLAQEGKGSKFLGGINDEQLRALVNDFASGSFATALIELARGAKISEIRKYKMTFFGPTETPAEKLSYILKLLCEKKKLDNFRMSSSEEVGDSLKTSSKLVTLFETAQWIDDNILKGKKFSGKDIEKQAVDEILEYFDSFNDPSSPNYGGSIFFKKLNDIIRRSYSSSNEEIDDDFVESIVNFFSNKKVLEKLVASNMDGKTCKIVFSDHVSVLFKDIKQLTFKDLPSNVRDQGIFMVGEIKKPVKLTEEKFNEFIKSDTIFMIGHDKEGKTIVFDAQMIKQLSNDYYEGFYDEESNTIVHNIFLNGPDGKQLISDVCVQDDTFTLRPKGWYNEYCRLEESKTQFYLAFGIASGQQYFLYLQLVEAEFSPMEVFEPYFPDETITRVTKFRVSREIVNPELDEYIKDINSPFMLKMDALCSVIDQLTGVFTVTKVQTGMPTIYVDELFFNLFIDKKDYYSVALFSEILAKIRPQEGDQKYNELRTIYNTIQYNDPDDPSWWCRLLTRYSVIDDELTPNLKDNELFYKSWLLLIQNDLLHGEDSSGLFEEYRDALFSKDTGYPKAFSLELVSTIEDILQKTFGNPMFSLLFFGIATFNEKVSNKDVFQGIHIEFLALTGDDVWKIFKMSKIQPLTSQLKDNKAYKWKSFQGQRNEIMTSCLVFGFRHFISGQKFTVRPSSSEGILNIYFENEPETQDEFEKARVQFTKLFYEAYVVPRVRAKKNTLGRMEFRKIFCEVVYDTINKYFNNRLYEKDNRFREDFKFLIRENPEVWKFRTIMQAMLIINTYIDAPVPPKNAIRGPITNKYKVEYNPMKDPVMECRNALYENRDAHFLIQASAGGSGRLQAYESNELLKIGIPITISKAKIRAMIDSDVAETLKANFANIKDINRYFLDFDELMTEDLKDRLRNQYKELKNMFYELKKEDDTWLISEKVFLVKIYVQQGGGIHKAKHISESYKSLGFINYEFTFRAQNEEQLESALISILFYRFAVPGSFIMVELKGSNFESKNFLNIDAKGIYPASFVATSIYGENNLKPKSMWDAPEYTWIDNQGKMRGLTLENFKKYVNIFGGLWEENLGGERNFVIEEGSSDIIFKDCELSLFIAYHNMGELISESSGQPSRNKLMLWYIYQYYFKTIIDKYGTPIMDLTNIDLKNKNKYKLYDLK